MSDAAVVERPVLVMADDGAPSSDVAWLWVTSHRWQGWALESVTVTEAPFPGGPVRGPVRSVPRTAPESAAFVSVDHLDVVGDPRVVLFERSDAALVVLGSHHHGHLGGLWAGSTTEWLVVRPSVPLLVAVHGHVTRTVAICVDGSTSARRALETFHSLPWSDGLEVTLVAVDDGATDVDRALTEAEATFAGRRPPAVVRRVGAARREIPAHVREQCPDLVVLGTRGLTGLARLTAGSTVSALLKDRTANLLLAHSAEQ
ncbi:universal stress protein [Actinotalea sp.]|uniref:universal stress protein n=1 Tax=Actinotalea sp. TaxID=1872145 RepID=UPI00356829AC